MTRRSHGRAERRIRSGLDGFFMLPLGVSAVTLGFGFLITLDEPPLDLRDSPLLVPIAQALVALPLVVRTLAPVLAGIDDRQRQAAASLGASPWRTLLTVDLPVVWKPLLAAAGFAFAVSLGEFGATSFLARDDTPTLPIVIFRLIGHPGEPELRHGAGRLRRARRHHGAGDARGRAAARARRGSVLRCCRARDRRRHRARTTAPAAVDGVSLDARRAARCSRCSAPPAAASPRCCARSPASSRSTAGAISLGRRRPRRRADPQARLRADVPGRPALRPPDASPRNVGYALRIRRRSRATVAPG